MDSNLSAADADGLDAAANEAAVSVPIGFTRVDGADHIACPNLAADGDDVLFVTTPEGFDLNAAGPRGMRVVGHIPAAANEQCDLAADASAYWIVYGGVTVPTGRDGQFFRIDRATGTSKRIFHTPHHESLRQLATSATTFYMAGEDNLLRAVTKDGKVTVFASYTDTAVSLSATPTKLLLATCRGTPGSTDRHTCAVVSYDKATKSLARHLVAHAGPAYVLVTDGETAWIPDDTAGTLLRVDVSTGATKVVATIDSIWGLAADASWVYVASHTNGTLTAIGKKDDRAVELASDLDDPQAVAVTHDALYVLTHVSASGYELPLQYVTPMAYEAVLVRGAKADLFARASATRGADR